MPKVRLVHVARAAGVSVSTASAALRGAGRMSADTRDRVQRVAAELGYRPDLLARGLRTGSTPMVGIIVDNLLNRGTKKAPHLFWPMTLLALTEYLTKAGVATASVSSSQTEPLAKLPISAIITVDVGAGPELPANLPPGVPVLVSGLPQVEEGQIAAYHEHGQATQDVMDHFHGQGSSRAAVLLPCPIPYLENVVQVSYDQWCELHGVEPYIIRPSAPEHLATELRTARDAGVDAVYSINGDSVSVVEALTAIGLKCPDDLLLVCLSEGILEQVMTPTVSTVSLQSEKTAEVVAAGLLAAIESGETTDIVCPYELTPRQSSLRDVT